MTKQKIVLSFIFIVCLIQGGFSQIGALPLSGCAPLQVNFTAPAGATSASWNFGNGSSTLLNPANIYNTPGVYNVTYTGSGGSPTSGNIQITVTANTVIPTFNFTIPSSHCAPMPVNFTGSGGSAGSTYQWAFGDGGQGNVGSLTHTYYLGGIFNTTLAVTDAAACTGTVTNGPVNVSAPANLNIAAIPGLSSCLAPFTTAFSASLSATGSPFGGLLSYSWNFGNSQSSTLESPGSITYNNQGSYNVLLTATDNNNCTTTITAAVTIVQPTMSVTAPASICIVGEQTSSPFFTVAVQSNASSIQVNMGGTLSAQPNPSPTTTVNFVYPLFNTPGPHNYTVTSTIGNCVLTQTQSVFVESITIQYVAPPPNYSCSPTFVINFINQTTVNTSSSLSYTWTVNHWNALNQYTSLAINPTFTLSQQSLSPYAWYGKFAPRVELEVISSLGCATSTLSFPDTLWRPTAWFNKSTREGCAPLVVKFRDSSSVSNIFPITSYTWNNGANPATLITGTIPPPLVQPTFTYSAPGTYTPHYSITTTNGCSAISFVDTIIVVTQPTVSITFTPNLSVCVGQPVQIRMTASPNSSLIQQWHAQSDEGFFSGCVADSMPTWFFSHIGVHGFTVSAYNHGCKAEAVTVQTITVKGPVARCRFQTNCANKKSVDFKSYLNDVQAATLNFGDGNFINLTGSPNGIASYTNTHVYGATGDYTAAITGSNSTTGCAPSTYSMLVQIREILAAFTVTNPVACRADNITFDASASVDVFVNCTRGYTYILDTTRPIYTPSKIFATDTTEQMPKIPGNHTVTLWVKDVNGCTSTQTKNFYIATPTASFTCQNPVCLSDMPLQFVNLTATSPAPAITYTWSFGTTPGATLQTNSLNTWPVFSYTAAQPSQNYVVTLLAQGYPGLCVDTFYKTITVINPPEAYLYPFELYPCVNTPVTFNPSPNTTYSVDFGDGSTIAASSATIVSHTYTAAGTYSPVLTLNYGGCLSSSPPGQGVVSVQDLPATNFTFFPTMNPTATGSVFCAPVSITFSSTSVPNGPGFDWDLGTGSPINPSVTVGTIFTSVGIHTISLTSYSIREACGTSITKSVSVLSPTANLTIDKTKICLGESIHLNIKDTSSVYAWIWYYGDGEKDTVFANSNTPPGISHQYTTYPQSTGATNVNLVYYSSAFTCTQTTNIALQLVKVDADFDRNLELSIADYVHCLNLTDIFTNKSKLNNSNNLTAEIFAWNFGDGGVSTETNPSYRYSSPGIYSITLITREPSLGCKSMLIKTMTINPIPVVNISVIDSVCKGSTFELTSSTTTDVSVYQWYPEAGVSIPNSATTTATAATSTTYSLVVTNIFGCRDTSDAQYIYVQQPAPIVRWDTTVIIGQTVIMNSNLGTNYSYTWSPVADISCSNCINPTSTTTANVTYSVEVEDNMKCFRVINTYTVLIDPLTSIDVPTAFTPNGDGVNDVIYVDGWGIKKLNYFRIFNRWGQLLFESNDIKVGWDGIYNGVPQNMENYVYQVSADTYVAGKSLQKASSFRLIR